MPQPQTTTTNNEFALEQIDQAITATKQAAHACKNPLAKEHLEYALALVTECWIAESDQQARDAQTVIGNVKQALNLFDALEAHTNNARKEGK
jgi:hypothetical protein